MPRKPEPEVDLPFYQDLAILITAMLTADPTCNPTLDAYDLYVKHWKPITEDEKVRVLALIERARPIALKAIEGFKEREADRMALLETQHLEAVTCH